MDSQEFDSIAIERINKKQEEIIKDRLNEIKIGDNSLLDIAEKRHDDRSQLQEKHSTTNIYINRALSVLEKKADYRESYTEELANKRKMLELWKNTASNQQAYFNILKHPELRQFRPYCRYASTYLIEQIEWFNEEYDLVFLMLSPSVEYTNKLGDVLLSFNDSNYTYNNYSTFTIPTLIKGEAVTTEFIEDNLVLSDNRRQLIEALQKQEEELMVLAGTMRNLQDKLQEIDHLKYSLLPKNRKEKIKENYKWRIDNTKERLLIAYSAWQRTKTRLEDISLTNEELAIERSQIITELLMIKEFLQTELGLTLKIN